ncbi:hypothetical protein GCM10009710_30290 [Aeromicrobium alkaliterrae]|uniref:Sortase n=1 Tax=Aeromicrobium alkaliterrae TaxID=302168 RepID=A0ABN2K4H0_9ACTN
MLGAGLVAVAVVGLVQRFDATHGDPAVIDDGVVTQTGDPDETPPDPACLSDYADDDPKRFSVASIDVTGCMQKVGVDREDRIAAPSNLHVAGWFVDAARPGTEGLSIVVGHQTGKYVGGIFDHLVDVEAGDEITIELGDGSVESYTITSAETHPVEDTMASLYADAEAQGASLALITCSGPYDSKIDQRRDRLVVLAASAP